MTASLTTSLRNAFAALFLMTAASLCAQTTSTVNFGSNDVVEISGGVVAATDPSGSFASMVHRPFA